MPKILYKNGPLEVYGLADGQVQIRTTKDNVFLEPSEVLALTSILNTHSFPHQGSPRTKLSDLA